MRIMKQLSDTDIQEMVSREFVPDLVATNRAVRAQLRLGLLVPVPAPVPRRATLDLHTLTEQQAWDAIMRLALSGTRDAVIITGASGILHQRFPMWARESILSPHIVSWAPINNGSFSVKFKRIKSE